MRLADLHQLMLFWLNMKVDKLALNIGNGFHQLNVLIVFVIVLYYNLSGVLTIDRGNLPVSY